MAREMARHGPGQGTLSLGEEFATEAFWRLSNAHQAKLGKLGVACYIKDDKSNATYTDKLGRFHHVVNVTAREHFLLEPVLLNSGMKAFVVVPAPSFPFEKLPAELRLIVYGMALGTGRTAHVSRYPASSEARTGSRLRSLLLSNRAICTEAREFLYSHLHFSFGAMNNFIVFMERIGDAKRFLTRLTIERSGTNLTTQAYQMLSQTARLRTLTITLPSYFKGTLKDHLNKHWESMKIFVFADAASQEESKRRLNIVTFRVGHEQKSVLGEDGQAIKLITPELNGYCKEFLGKKLEAHLKGSI